MPSWFKVRDKAKPRKPQTPEHQLRIQLRFLKERSTALEDCSIRAVQCRIPQNKYCICHRCDVGSSECPVRHMIMHAWCSTTDKYFSWSTIGDDRTWTWTWLRGLRRGRMGGDASGRSSQLFGQNIVKASSLREAHNLVFLPFANPKGWETQY